MLPNSLRVRGNDSSARIPAPSLACFFVVAATTPSLMPLHLLGFGLDAAAAAKMLFLLLLMPT